jgi:hypothetical protein
MPATRLTKAASNLRCKTPSMWLNIEGKLMKELDLKPDANPGETPQPATDTTQPSLKCRGKAALKKQEDKLLRESDSATVQRYLTMASPQLNTMQGYLAGPTDKGTSLLLMCRAGSLLTNKYTCGWTKDATDSCPSCEGDCSETVSHLLFDCPAYQNLTGGRTALHEKIASLLTPEQLLQWQNVTPQSAREASLLGDSWLGGPTTALQPALKQFLKAAWTARQANIDRAAALEKEGPTGETNVYNCAAADTQDITGEETYVMTDSPSRTPAISLPAPAVRLSGPTVLPTLLDPSLNGHSGTTDLQDIPTTAHHTNDRRSSLRSHGHKVSSTACNSKATHLRLPTTARTTTSTTSELGARHNPNQTGLSTLDSTALPYGRVANGSDAKA